MALDVVCLVVPFATGSGALKATVKAANAVDNVLDAAKAANKVDNVTDIVKAANRADDVKDAFKPIAKLAEDAPQISARILGNSDTITKSSKKAGQMIHSKYMTKYADDAAGLIKENQLANGAMRTVL